jgi:hypothetical protein
MYIKKKYESKHEKLAKLPTVEKDLVYVPAFTNEKGLRALVEDIHEQFKEAQSNGEESGWDGDAGVFDLKNAMGALDFKYLLTIGGSNLVFAFASPSDRSAVISDYLPDPDAM